MCQLSLFWMCQRLLGTFLQASAVKKDLHVKATVGNRGCLNIHWFGEHPARRLWSSETTRLGFLRTAWTCPAAYMTTMHKRIWHCYHHSPLATYAYCLPPLSIKKARYWEKKIFELKLTYLASLRTLWQCHSVAIGGCQTVQMGIISHMGTLSTS